jgi:DNA-binding NtrC family response regulator
MHATHKKSGTSQRKKSESNKVASGTHLLIATEDTGIRESMTITFRREGYQVQAAQSGDQALEAASRMPFDLVITDLQLADMDGIDLLKQLKALSADTEVIVVTAYGNTEPAVKAVRLGAYDYLAKPFLPEELALAARRALERKRLAQKVRVLEDASRNRDPIEELIGTSPSMINVVRMITQVARLDSTVLISGEMGTGKELIARALHDLSPRKEKPLVLVNCSAIPGNLQEDELFGHAKGAFPGAHKDKRGLLEEAHRGTAFLDEIGDLVPQAQVKMLRFLQNGEARKLGAKVDRRLDVRVIAATKQDLESAVEGNTFREDLYYRLSVIPIRLPPLRERSEDIPLLAQHFVKITSNRMDMSQPPSISPRAMSYMVTRPWRGNVRELHSVLERAVALDRDGIIGMDDLPMADSDTSEDKVLERARQSSLTLSELEREYILEVLAENGGSRKNTAERLGITTATLWRKLKQYEKEG